MKLAALFLFSFCALAVSMPTIAQSERRGGTGQNVLSEGPLPDLDAYTADGKAVKLRELCKDQYTVLVSGCLTCPKFHQSYDEIEAASVDYAPKGVGFYFFYKSLRHPELNGHVEPQNMKERLLHVEAAKEKLGTKVPWLADTLEDSMRVGLRAGSHSVYLVSPKGEIIFASTEIDGESLRTALGKAVGLVEPPTRTGDLGLPRVSRATPQVNEDTEVRVERPTNMVILKSTPESPEDTYYVKLRVEAEPELLRTGKGRLFLGFYPDPIHEAKWNNLVAPMQYELELPEGVKATPAKASGPKVERDTDTEPRQFWVEIDSEGKPGDIKLSLHYFACTPDFCEAMTHNYTISFEDEAREARTYGIRRNRGGNDRGGRGERGGRRERGERGGPEGRRQR